MMIFMIPPPINPQGDGVFSLIVRRQFFLFLRTIAKKRTFFIPALTHFLLLLTSSHVAESSSFFLSFSYVMNGTKNEQRRNNYAFAYITYAILWPRGTSKEHKRSAKNHLEGEKIQVSHVIFSNVIPLSSQGRFSLRHRGGIK